MIDIISIVLVLVSTVFAAFASLSLKKASGNLKLNVKSLFNKHLILGMIVYLLSTVTFIAALRRENVSVLYPITALSYIWVSLLSVKVLKEKMNKHKWLGILFIILGVILITF